MDTGRGGEFAGETNLLRRIFSNDLRLDVMKPLGERKATVEIPR